MKKNLLKTISILFVMIALVISLSLPVFANSAIINSTNSGFDTTFEVNDSSGATPAIARVGGALISILQVLGLAVAIIMLMWLAITYIASSANEKAQIKKQAITYVTGAIILFGATGILQIIKKFALKNVNGEDGKQ